MNTVWQLTKLKIDYWLLNNLRVGFMSYLNNILKEDVLEADLADFKHYLWNYGSTLN